MISKTYGSRMLPFSIAVLLAAGVCSASAADNRCKDGSTLVQCYEAELQSLALERGVFEAEKADHLRKMASYEQEIEKLKGQIADLQPKATAMAQQANNARTNCANLRPQVAELSQQVVQILDAEHLDLKELRAKRDKAWEDQRNNYGVNQPASYAAGVQAGQLDAEIERREKTFVKTLQETKTTIRQFQDNCATVAQNP